jgi:hypothetical protein
LVETSAGDLRQAPLACDHRAVLAGLTAEEWTAIGTMAAAAILLVTLLYAIKQVREARNLRRETFRPWVTVRFHFRIVFAFIAIKAPAVRRRETCASDSSRTLCTRAAGWGSYERDATLATLPCDRVVHGTAFDTNRVTRAGFTGLGRNLAIESG